ncbi:MAG: hypothetical protein H0W63_05540 [Gemmatimonadaceae bacterium]|nr:hypothetical protein [Gemmatimonadaceae bacterium]
MNVLLNPDRKPVIAHRGGRARAPENTLEAMRLGIADGADALEFDVRISEDGEVVVIHDPTVDRTTDGKGSVERKTLRELKSLSAGSNAARIPTLDEVLRSFPATPLLIEIKASLAAAGTRRLIEKYRAEDRCLVDSYSSTALAIFHGSRIAHGPGRNGMIGLLARSLSGARGAVPLNVSALSIPPTYHGLPLPVGYLARTMRSAGKPVHIWTVNDPDEARGMWRLGVSGIITDDVPAILAAR